MISKQIVPSEVSNLISLFGVESRLFKCKLTIGAAGVLAEICQQSSESIVLLPTLPPIEKFIFGFRPANFTACFTIYLPLERLEHYKLVVFEPACFEFRFL